jgi:hypothetical protein
MPILFKHKKNKTKKKTQTPWPLVRERTIPTDRPPILFILYLYLLLYHIVYLDYIVCDWFYIRQAYCGLDWIDGIYE